MAAGQIAFLSYAHRDDRYHGGAITELREQLGLAVSVATGDDFEIFQDRDGIDWGQHWPERLDRALGEVRFLIPILTPSFFKSDACRDELAKFIELEERAGRNDLILPIYYVPCSVLDDEVERAADPLATLLHKRQYRDWRPHRHKPFADPVVKHALDALGQDIVKALRRPQAASSRRAGSHRSKPKAATRVQAESALQEAPAAFARSETPAQTREPGNIFRDTDAPSCPELVVLPTGEFQMGSPADEPGARDNEKPQHEVTIAYPLAVGRYPVTFEEWDAFVADEPWHRSKHIEPYSPGDEKWGRGRRPLINVSWDDLQGYLRWLSEKTGQRYRLLSEAEWEYACRAGTTTPYSVGSTITHYDANFGEKAGKTTEVGSYAPNPFGLYDMHGNVWEWVEDCSNKSYKGAPTDGSAWLQGDCSVRVLRGGSWHFLPEFLWSAFRSGFPPVLRNYGTGFRVARMLTP